MRKMYCFPANVLLLFNKAALVEAHVESGHVLLLKALMNSMKGCSTLFRKCRICSWKLHSCLFNIKYIYIYILFEKHKLV